MFGTPNTTLQDTLAAVDACIGDDYGSYNTAALADAARTYCELVDRVEKQCADDLLQLGVGEMVLHQLGTDDGPGCGCDRGDAEERRVDAAEGGVSEEAGERREHDH